jgi:hypothetical protein
LGLDVRPAGAAAADQAIAGPFRGFGGEQVQEITMQENVIRVRAPCLIPALGRLPGLLIMPHLAS